MSKRNFYYCSICHNLFEILTDSGATPTCCGQNMTKLQANTTDAAVEKHVPAVTRNGKDLSVQIGSVVHPMEEKHYIMWIMVSQNNKTYRVDLKPGEKPVAKFQVEDASAPVSVYEFCNLHGLWTTEA